jgi:pantoate--beta-alanine ligase
MQLFRTTSEVADFRKNLRVSGKSLGLVPTMGALHAGHISLVEKAQTENDLVMVTIFVNPTQFNNKEDLEKYPRTLDLDLALLREVSQKVLVFAPDANEVYAGNVQSRKFDFGGLDLVMEGAFRPGHFDGVGTIVERLFRLIEPHKAYFGEKDYQQLQIIRNLTKQLDLPIEIIGCPIVRESNGLALSSRNARLSEALREKASAIYRSLCRVRESFAASGITTVSPDAMQELSQDSDFELEYFLISDSETLASAESIEAGKKYRAFIAVHLGGVRLIDNIALN